MKNFSNLEILQVIDAVSHEKSISKDNLFQLIEDALEASAKRQYGFDHSIHAVLDRNTGEIKLFRELIVVENNYDFDKYDIENNVEQKNAKETTKRHERIHERDVPLMMPIRIEDAQKKATNVAIGDILREDLPPLDINRFAARIAKNVMSVRIKEIERDKQYEEFKNRVGEVVQGTVDKVEFGNLIVKIGDAEAILKRSDLLRSDRYRRGDRIKAYLAKINRQSNEPQLVLSRIANEFVAKLFEHEVPEIYDHIVEIIAVVRDPGSRSKIAVYASDPGIDPVGACVGIRGSRVQAVINELHGEKIDIIQWTDDKAKLVLNALAPLDVLRLVIDEKNNCVEVVVEDEQESAAIGRRGQNVRLIAALVGMNVIIMTKDNEARHRKKETEAIVKIFIDKLDLEEMLAQLLVAEGYTKINELANASVESLLKIPGLDITIAQELIERALESQRNVQDTFIKKLNITSDLAQVMVKKDFDSIEKLSYAQADDLIDENLGIDKEIAKELIERARGYKREFTASTNSSSKLVIDNKVDDVAEKNILDMEKLTEFFPGIVQILNEAGIKTIQEIADFDNIELKEFLEERGYSCDISAINGAIMAARSIANENN